MLVELVKTTLVGGGGGLSYIKYNSCEGENCRSTSRHRLVCLGGRGTFYTNEDRDKTAFRCLSFLKSVLTILWINQFERMVHEVLSKTNRFNSFRTKSLRKYFPRQNFDFCGRYFLSPF